MTSRPLRTAFLVAAASLVSISAHAQSTAAGIFGHGPAGSEVTATSATGAQRHATINGKGRYTLSPLGMGTYTVTLKKGDEVVDTRKNIVLTVGRGAEVDFACPNDNCASSE